MNRTDLIRQVRFLFNDTATANYIQRESLVGRPGNIFDGNNKLFFLLNRRVVSMSLYDGDNVPVSPLAFVADLPTGKITFVVAPTGNIYADYYWQKLTDAEIGEAITAAGASGGFNPDNFDLAMLDYCAKYTLAYCYLSAASKCAEYYTLSAAGKQVSKSELFNHYNAMYQQALNQAIQLRTDSIKDRGLRDVPADATATSDWAQPYLIDSGGG